MNRGDADARMMRRALALARRGLGRTAPNPPVGAVIARRGRIIGQGWHRGAGLPHAEVEALRDAGTRSLRGATLYVTLEPCNHLGRTPPCTEAVLRAGIGRVVIGTRDPNPGVRGGGVERLRAAGVEVACGVLGERAEALIRPFAHWLRTGRPLVLLKAAVTLDGFLATRTGDSRWVSGERSRKEVHRLRSESNAILVGAGTLLADDPSLDARIRGGSDPRRVVLDGALRSPPTARAFRPCDAGPTLVYCAEGAGARRRLALERAGAEVVALARQGRGRISMADLLDDLGRRGIHQLLVEGGGQVFRSFLTESTFDRAMIFIAPKILGGSDGVPMVAGQGPQRMAQALRLYDVEVRRFGEDTCICGTKRSDRE